MTLKGIVLIKLVKFKLIFNLQYNKIKIVKSNVQKIALDQYIFKNEPCNFQILQVIKYKV